MRDPEIQKAGLTIKLLCLIIHRGRTDVRLNKLVTHIFSALYNNNNKELDVEQI